MREALGGRSKWDFFGSGASAPRQQPGAADPWAQRPKQAAQQQQQQRQARPQQARPGSQQRRQQQQQQMGGKSFNDRLGDMSVESNPQWRWPTFGGLNPDTKGTRDLRERITRITK